MSVVRERELGQKKEDEGGGKKRTKKERTENVGSRMWTPKSVDRHNFVQMKAIFMRTVSASRALIASAIGSIYVEKRSLAQA